MDTSFWTDPPRYLTAFLLAVIVLLLLVIWSHRRHRDPKLRIECSAPIEELIPSLAGLSLSTVVPGNALEILENAAFYDVLIERIRAARSSVHFETFLWQEGRLERRVADALADRAKAGVTVRLLLDGTGSRKIGKAALKDMENAGCKIAFFHDNRLRNIGVLNDRTHRKLVVIDGREAFVGGHCIKDEWFGGPEDGEHFADVSVRLHGPIVSSIQSAFSENWTGQTGELFAGEKVFPSLEQAGTITIHAAYSKPEGSAPAVKILHHTAICLARKRIWIQNPYFIPEPDAIRAFGQAVERGVDVRILMPAVSGSDNPMVQYAGHRNFEAMLKYGVRLFEYPHTLLHQKVMTIDGVWSAVGSTNFDDRSFETNDEITLGIFDSETTAQLDGIFEKYAKDAKEIKLEEWRKRPWTHKLKEHVFYLLNEVL
ncbi:MAG: phospholipase D-like domain-containing protein [Burkholderiaceae bacterium]